MINRFLLFAVLGGGQTAENMPHTHNTQILTVNNMHLTSLAAPKQPKNEIKHTIADVTINV